MGYDMISNAHVCAFNKVSSKKKRGNKMAKLKQNKGGGKREQWCVNRMIQVSDKNCKVGSNGIGGTHPPSVPNVSKGRKVRGDLPRMTRDMHEVLPIPDSEVITWVSSSINRKSGCANLGNDFHRVKGRSSITGSCSSSCSDDDRDKGFLSDWDGVADALSLDTGTEVLVLEQHNKSESLSSEDGSQCVNESHHHQRNSRAWTPDDVFRPQSLPRISGQQNHAIQNSRCDCSTIPAIFSWQSAAVPVLQQSICPICCEDFDITDSSFLPCPCGFKLCLFCHKRILEVDGRCPGCRKHYGSANAGSDLPVVPSEL